MTETESMVVRVAKAVGTILYGYVDPVDTPNTWATSLEAARAAIEAMREPTPAMGYAGLRVRLTEQSFAIKTHTDDDRILTAEEMSQVGFRDSLQGNPTKWSYPIYRAMIDAALVE